MLPSVMSLLLQYCFRIPGKMEPCLSRQKDHNCKISRDSYLEDSEEQMVNERKEIQNSKHYPSGAQCPLVLPFTIGLEQQQPQTRHDCHVQQRCGRRLLVQAPEGEGTPFLSSFLCSRSRQRKATFEVTLWNCYS